MVVGYIIVLLFIAGVLEALGLRILSIIVLVGGTYIGAFTLFREHGVFILMYKGMVYFAFAAVVIWLAKAIIVGITHSYKPDINFGEIGSQIVQMGIAIGVYGFFMVMFGGASENVQFGPLSIMTIIGDAGYLKGFLILFGGGFGIALIASLVEPFIERLSYNVKLAAKKA